MSFGLLAFKSFSRYRSCTFSISALDILLKSFLKISRKMLDSICFRVRIWVGSKFSPEGSYALFSKNFIKVKRDSWVIRSFSTML